MLSVQVTQDLGLMPCDIAVDRLVSQQLGNVALGNHQV